MIKKIFETIFSIKFEENFYRTYGGHIILTILGLKFKFKIMKFKNNIKKDKLDNCVAIISPNGIGDYMLVRQFFKYIKNSKKYKDCHLILFEQPHHINFSKFYDAEYFDDIVVYNKNPIEFVPNIKKILKNYQFKTVINLSAIRNYSSVLLEKIRFDFVKILDAPEKIADVILSSDDDIPRKSYPYNLYSEVIYTKPNSFEFERRRKFFEQLLEETIPIEDVFIDTPFDFTQKYITLSLLSTNVMRNYPDFHWVKIINYILDNTDKSYKLLFIGTNIDYTPTQEIIEKVSDSSRCINLCGLTDLTLIPIILKNSKFLLSPETGTVHIAASVGCESICLSSGAHYGRFLPHKKYISYIFPKDFQKLIDTNNTEKLKNFYFPNYEFPVETIEVNEVINAIKEIIQKG